MLNKVLEGLTSLHLRALSMQCSVIASPNLCCLTVIKLDSGRLPGANPSSVHQVKRSLTALDMTEGLCDCMQWALVPSCRACTTALGAPRRRILSST